MTRFHKICLFSLLTACLLMLCGCSADDIRLPEQIDLFVGQEFALASAVEVDGEVSPETIQQVIDTAQAQGIPVQLTSENPAVAEVDEAGMVQGIAAGETTISVQCDALDYSAQVEVLVLQPAANLTIASTLEMASGETASLAPAVENADTADLLYTVEDPTVVRVDEGGNVTALTEGHTYITASLPGSSLSAVCEVTVGTVADSIQISRPEAVLAAGKSMTLAASVQPSDVAQVTWQSSDPDIATVENGVVTALQAGTARITATAGGKTAFCSLTVTETATPETATPESATPETATPETATTESATPETATPETATAESATPETATPETATAESATPETSTAESATPETATPETATAESATPETATPETATAESATPETATAESATPETATPETATAESATPETATPETATAESATPETATSESGSAEPGGDAPQQSPSRRGLLGFLEDLWTRLTGG